MKKYVLVLMLMILFIVPSPVHAESGVDHIFVTPVSTIQEPVGSAEDAYIFNIAFQPTGIIFQNQDTAKYADLRGIVEPGTSPMYSVRVERQAMDLYLGMETSFANGKIKVAKNLKQPVTLTVLGKKDNYTVVQTFVIPETETVWPVPGQYEILEPYGEPRNNQYGYHHGVDISTPTEGVPVIAATSGVVTYAGSNQESAWYGNHVIIEKQIQDKKYRFIYGHLSQFSVSQGDTVSPGHQIGVSGNSMWDGAKIPHHLHFEIRDITDGDTTVNAAIDPFLIIPQK